MKGRFLKKLCAAALSVLMLGSVGITGTVPFAGGGLSASAAEKLAYGDYQYKVNDNDEITITNYTGSDTELIIPDTIEGKKVTSIGEKAFYLSKSIVSVTIPDSIKEIGARAFSGCKSLEKVKVSDDLIKMSFSVFENTPWYNNQPDGDIYIGSTYYKYKGTMPADTKVVVRNGTKSLAGDAFAECSNLSGITLPDGLVYIGLDCFYNCKNLTRINLPDSLDVIDKYAFSVCSKLVSVKLPENLKNINYAAFNKCSSLSSIQVPDSVTYIGSRAFDECGLKSISLGNGITRINSLTFRGCKSLQKIDIPEGVEVIDEKAFYNCSNIKNITIPDTVITINHNAFLNCDNLRSLMMPQSIKELNAVNLNCKYSESSFYSHYPSKLTLYGIGGTYVESYYGASDHVDFVDISSVCNGFKYIQKDDHIAVVGYDWNTTVINVPSEINGIPVTEIANYAFEGTDITEIVLPDSISIIGKCAFKDCAYLKKITLPSGMKQFHPRGYGEQFSGCYSLESIILPENMEALPDKAFFGCESLKELTLPSGIKSIGEKTFEDCTSLVLIGAEGSSAQAYAKENNITFKAIPIENCSAISSAATYQGKSITIKLAAKHGKPPYKYTVLYKTATASKWTTLVSGSTKTEVKFTPVSYAYYYIRIIAKDAKGKTAASTFRLNVKKSLANNSRLAADTIYYGGGVRVRGAASGGAGGYNYTVSYKKTTASAWTALAANSTSTLFTLRPATTGKYYVRVVVKDKAGNSQTKTMTLTVKAALANNSRLAAETIKKGGGVRIRGAASGGAGGYNYTVLYRKTTASSWTALASNSTSTLFTLRPAAAGKYYVRVIVKDSAGNSKTKTMILNVTK